MRTEPRPFQSSAPAEYVDSRGGSNVVGNPRRNLALNRDATTFELTSYPYATSNSHWKYLDETSPKAVVDGVAQQDAPCWKPNRRTDLWLKIEFGRQVDVDEAVITLAIPEAQSQSWKSDELLFDDGKKVRLELEFTTEPQRFKFDPKTTSAITLQDLRQELPLADVGVAEIEIWGADQPADR